MHSTKEQEWRKRGGGGGRIEGTALLLADPDFQTLRHPWP